MRRYNSDQVISAGILGLVFGFLTSVIVLTVLGFGTAPVHYKENVCSYSGGVMKDDVCIVNGRVFEIKEPNANS